MSYISHSTKNSPWNNESPEINRTNVCILIIDRKESTRTQQVLKDIPGQQLTGKCKKVHFIATLREKNIIRKNPIENISIFKKIRHIHEIGKN